MTSSLGDEFLEVAELAGMRPDPWQRLAVHKIMGLRNDGQLASPRAAMCLPRQNGKGGVLEILELGRLFVLGSTLTIHSAHLFKTAKEAYLRIRNLVENCPDLDKLVKRYPATNGDEGIILKNGVRLGFVARTSGGGRGLTGDCVILDEAMYLPDAVMSALTYTVSARKFNQIIYAGSAVDQVSMPDGRPFAILRNEAIKGEIDWLTYLEWSLPYDKPEDIPADMLVDVEAWRQANPAFGIRIDEETIRRELLNGPRSFSVERLNVGDWPSVDDEGGALDYQKWQAMESREAQPTGKIAFGFDVSPNRAWGSICVADGRGHVEFVERDRGTGWLPARIAELRDKHQPSFIVCDERGPAHTLVPELERLGVKVETVNTSEVVQACGLFFDAVEQQTLRHRGHVELNNAVRVATKRPLGERFAWDRAKSTSDITPLVAVTLAHWKAEVANRPEPIAVWA